MSFFKKLWKKIVGEGKKIVIRVAEEEYERLSQEADEQKKKLDDHIKDVLRRR